jgi:hypothetical protein
MGGHDGPYPLGPAAVQQRNPLSDSGNILQPEARLADFERRISWWEVQRAEQRLPARLTTLVFEFG